MGYEWIKRGQSLRNPHKPTPVSEIAGALHKKIGVRPHLKNGGLTPISRGVPKQAVKYICQSHYH